MGSGDTFDSLKRQPKTHAAAAAMELKTAVHKRTGTMREAAYRYVNSLPGFSSPEENCFARNSTCWCIYQ